MPGGMREKGTKEEIVRTLCQPVEKRPIGVREQTISSLALEDTDQLPIGFCTL
jgi:hypothetical protein